MNILPGKTPCLRCLYPEMDDEETFPTCKTAGVLGSITNIIASIESTEAIKILIGSSKVRQSLFKIDVWNNSSEYFDIERNVDCPICGEKKGR